MDIFEECSVINDLLQANKGVEARNRLILLLDNFRRENQSYDPLLNHLIRESGLYPYLEPETSSWQDRFVFESFKVDIGQDAPVTRHISPFIAKLSKAFLPSCVMELEEYGLPRMLAKRIHACGLINFEDEKLDLHSAIRLLCELKPEILAKFEGLDDFDRYVLDYFYEGIATQ